LATVLEEFGLNEKSSNTTKELSGISSKYDS
jgi:hypothetical protein